MMISVPYDGLTAADNLWPLNLPLSDALASDFLSTIKPPPYSTTSGAAVDHINRALISGDTHVGLPESKLLCHWIPPKGRVSKRKSRALNLEATTFIVADPENFMQMVQQVTGGKLDDIPMEPRRLKAKMDYTAGWLQEPTGGLPVLNSAGFVVDWSGSGYSPAPLTAMSDAVEAAAKNCFDSFSYFPTLESWKAV